MKNLAPIVLFTYNRPDHTRKTVEALQKNTLAQQSQLFIYSDAPKNQAAKEQVTEVREYLKTIKGFKQITIIERDKNWGLANSIIDGVTQIVNEYGKIIVLEDDLVTSPYFLQFMNEALEFYQDEEQVMHISGYMFPINNKSLNKTFFIKPASCWSWATWDRAWKYFKKDTDFYVDKFDKKMIKDFNLNNSYRYFDQILLNKKGKLNTWAIFWYATCYLRNGLSLHPKSSFVQNIGNDGSGMHCGESNQFSIEKLAGKENIKFFTNNIKEDVDARMRIEEFFKQSSSIAFRIKRKVITIYNRTLN